MEKTEFKNLVLIAAAFTLLTFTSCEEDEVAEPTPVTIVASDMAYSVGSPRTLTNLDLSSMPSIISKTGANQLWDFSGVRTESNFTSVAYQNFSDNTLPGANYSFEGTVLNTITGLNVNALYIRENSSRGIFEVSTRLLADDKVSIFQGAGDLTFLKGDQVNENGGIPLYTFPINFEDEYSHTSTTLANFTANLPFAGLVNTPANTLDSTFSEIKVQGWGEIKLPGYNKSFEVLQQKISRKLFRYYLLGGSPAPDNLLAGLGLVQGDDLATEIITYITPNHGVVATVFFTNGVLTSANFRSDLPN